MPGGCNQSMYLCKHIERGINLEKLSNLSKSKLTQCEACLSQAKLLQKKSTRLTFSTQQSCQQEERWVCLACGHVACDSLVNQQSVVEEQDDGKVINKKDATKAPAEGHAWGHFTLLRHPLAMQIGDNHVYWCFACNMPVDYPVPSLESSNDLQAAGWKNPLQEAADVVKGKSSKKKGLFKDSAKVCYTMEPVRVVIDTVRSVIDSATHLKAADASRLSTSLIGAHSSDYRNKRFVKGLCNLGNTCFFNSVLQNLLALDALRNHFCSDPSNNEGSLTSSLRSLFQEMNSEKVLPSHLNAPNSDFVARGGGRATVDAKVCNPSALFDAICAKAPRFRGFQQQDCHELLRYLMEGLNSEERGAMASSYNVDYKQVITTSLSKVLGQNGNVGDSETAEGDKEHGKAGKFCNVVSTLVGNVFGGQLSSTVHCLECGYVSVVYETMLDLSLQIPTKHISKKRQACEVQKTSKVLGPRSQDSLKEDIKNGKRSGILETEETSVPSSLETTANKDYMLDSSRSMQTNCLDSTLHLWSMPSKNNCSDRFPCGSEAENHNGPLRNEFSQENLHSVGMPENANSLNAKTSVPTDDHNCDMGCSALEECIDLSRSKMDTCKNINFTFDDPLLSESFPNGLPGDSLAVDSKLPGDSLAVDSHDLLGGKDLSATLSDNHLRACALLPHDEKLATTTSTNEMGLAGHDYATTFCKFPNVACKEGNEILKPGSTEHVQAHSRHLESAETAPGEIQEMEGMEACKGWSNSSSVLEMPNLVEFNRRTSCKSSADVTAALESEQLFESEDIGSSLTLEDCLADFVKSELLCGENAWECEKCSTLVERAPQSLSFGNATKLGRGHSLNRMTELSDECIESKVKKDTLVNTNDLLRTSSMNFEVSFSVPTVCNSKVGLSQSGCPKGNTSEGICSFVKVEDHHKVSKMEGKCDSQSLSLEKSIISQPLFDNHEQQEGNGLSHSSSKMLSNLKVEKFSFLSNIFFKAENIKGKADQQKVRVKRQATKKLLVRKTPSVLTVHLKRFAQDFCGSLNKLSGHVAFSEYLNLQPFLDARSPDRNDCIYRLVGIVEHGGTMRGGHYVAYVRCPDDETSDPKESSWYLISDSVVSKCTVEDVLGREAYLLFYERHNGKKEG